MKGLLRRASELGLYAAAPLAIFVTSPLLAQGLGPADRGQLGIIQAILSIAVTLGALGQAEVFLADLRNGSESLRTSGRLTLAGGITAAITAAVVAASLGVDLVTAIVAAAFIPVINQGQLWRSYAVSQHHLMRPAAAGAIGAGVRVAFIAMLAALGLLSTLSAITVIQFATAAGVVIALGWYVLRTYPHTVIHVTQAQYVDHLRRGSPILIFAALTSVTLRADLFFLNDLVDPSTLGVYAAASSLSMSVLAVSGAFKSRIQSAVFKPGARRAVYLELAVVLGIGLVGATLAALLSPWIVATLLGPGYEAAIPILRILAFASAALLVLDSVHGLLAVLGLRRSMLAVAAVGAGVTLITLPLLISVAGASGAAWATVISYSVASITGLFVVRSALMRERPGDGVPDRV